MSILFCAKNQSLVKMSSKRTQLTMWIYTIILVVLLGTTSRADGQEYIRVTSDTFRKTYLVEPNNLLDFNQSQGFCLTNGGKLAGIKSREEWQWFVTNVNEQYDLDNPFYWIGAKPVGPDQEPTHWLDGSKIDNYFWQYMPRTDNGDCNGLIIDTNDGKPRFQTTDCISKWPALCEIDLDSNGLQQKNCNCSAIDSKLNRVLEAVQESRKYVTDKFEGQSSVIDRLLNVLLLTSVEEPVFKQP